MKISELNDEDILNFLMTSDFDGDYSPSEFKYLLSKWKYFHRLFQGKSEQNRMTLENTIKRLQEELEVKKNNEYNLQVENAKQKDLNAALIGRKLSYKERWKGKIILDNENK